MKHNAFLNMFFAALSKCVGIVGPFAVRTIIVYKLGNEYVGLNSLFTSLLNVLNLAELGFGSAMTFSMYKPANDGDYEKFSALLNFYKFVYRIIGGVILIIGILVTPFVKYLIKGAYPEDLNLYILFFIYLLNTVASYTLFAYKSSILIANCRNDILYAIQGTTQILMYTVQIAALILTENYYIYIIFLPIFTIVNNALVCYVTKREYPQYVDAGRLSIPEKRVIFTQIRALLVHKLAGVLINSLDNIVISTILGLNALALFSNYFYLVNAINGMIEIVMTSVVSTIGHQLLNQTEEQSLKQFYVMSYISNILIGLCTVCFFNLFQVFITLWVGAENLLPVSTMILFCIYFYTWRMRSVGLLYRDAAGLWKKDALKSVVGVILDLVLDIILVMIIGIDGALLSTIVIMAFIFYPWETKVLYRNLFHSGSWKNVQLTIQNAVTTVVLCLFSWWFLGYIKIDNAILEVIGRLFFSITISILGFVLPTIWTEEFRAVWMWFTVKVK